MSVQQMAHNREHHHFLTAGFHPNRLIFVRRSWNQTLVYIFAPSAGTIVRARSRAPVRGVCLGEYCCGRQNLS